MIIREINEAFISQIKQLLNRDQLAYNWENAFNLKLNKDGFAVRVSSGLSADGTNQTLTKRMDFEVLLLNKFTCKGQNDAGITEAIMRIHDDLQLIEVNFYKRKLGIQRVLLVENIDTSAPDIDNDIGSVSITSTFSVLYRLGV